MYAPRAMISTTVHLTTIAKIIGAPELHVLTLYKWPLRSLGRSGHEILDKCIPGNIPSRDKKRLYAYELHRY